MPLFQKIRVPERIRARWRWISGAAALLLVMGTFYTVGENEVAVVTLFGRPVTVTAEPGLHVKLPWQTCIYVDRRLNVFNPQPSELLTRDKKNLVVDVSVFWRVDDPQRFLQAVGDRAGAESRLQDLVKSEVSIAMGNTDLANLASTDPAQVRIPQIMAAVTGRCAAASRGEYGIQLVDIGLRRINLPEENKESVFARMRAERERIARQYRAEGSEQAAKIRAEADREKTEILAQAYEEAEKTRGEGDAQSMKIYASAYNRDPDFYRLTRTLEAYKKFLNEKTTIVLSSDSDLMRLLTTGQLSPKGQK